MKITKPTLVIDEQKARKNIETMLAKANANKILLRPHFKTHQSAHIAKWYWDAGIRKATVSSVEMATYFANAGWIDITIAFPYNPLEHEEIKQLSSRIQLNVLIESEDALAHLITNVKAAIGYFLKIDVGTHRTGIDPKNEELIKKLTLSNSDLHRFQGILAHAGHSYQNINKSGAQAIFDDSLDKMNRIKSLLGDPNMIISYGDTPTCSLLDSFSGVDELRPGNFLFYDLMQHHFGVCETSDIAVCMVCPVVSIHPERAEAVIYGGGVHFSKEVVNLPVGKTYGAVVSLSEEGWSSEPIANLARISQEHGIIQGTDEYIDSLKIGDLVGILPVHSCLTANLQPYYVSLIGQKIDKFNRANL
ncbi:MAG: D-serine deaminase-like pyridoxal phosphate-dependent protein [Marinoscillum sp.]|jgi:D-serine deaminase-like pyridoxal phosphate-dependent protein